MEKCSEMFEVLLGDSCAVCEGVNEQEIEKKSADVVGERQ